MIEKHVAAIITDALTEAGALWHWCADSRRCRGPKGLPDILAVTRHGLIALEIKGWHSDGHGGKRRGKLRPEQREWLAALNAAGIRVGVVTPENATAVAAWIAAPAR